MKFTVRNVNNGEVLHTVCAAEARAVFESLKSDSRSWNMPAYSGREWHPKAQSGLFVESMTGSPRQVVGWAETDGHPVVLFDGAPMRA